MGDDPRQIAARSISRGGADSGRRPRNSRSERSRPAASRVSVKRQLDQLHRDYPCLRFSLTDVAKGFVDTIVREMQRPIAKAATAAMRDAGDIAKRNGRASIAAAGFSRKWQNALRVNIYPPQGDSMRPAAFIFHKIRYAGVFEEGAVIRGQPLLWLPLANVPLRRGRPMTPSQYVRSVGPLVSVERPGRPPLLFAKYRARRSRRRAADSLSASRSMSGYRASRSRKRFDIKGAAQKAAAQLPALYAKHLRD